MITGGLVVTNNNIHCSSNHKDGNVMIGILIIFIYRTTTTTITKTSD